MTQTPAVTGRGTLDDRDREILSTRAFLFWARHFGPSVGDYVDFADGVTRRISHVWTFGDLTVQTSDGGSFYLGEGYCSFSGGLHPGVAMDTLALTGAMREGAVWFFHHDYTTAHNGVYTSMPFAVYTCSLPSN